MQHFPKKQVAVFVGTITIASVAIILFLFLNDIIGEQEFEHFTLKLIGIGVLCGILAIAGVSLARLEDPREETSIYDAKDTRLP